MTGLAVRAAAPPQNTDGAALHALSLCGLVQAANPFGALLFNALVALGLPWLILGTYADVFPPARGTWLPSLVGFGCILIALLALLLCRLRLTRGLGVGLLSLYVLYLTVIIHDGSARPARPPA